MPLLASQILGLILVRYVLAVEPVASMTADEVVAIYAPTLQRYLGPMPAALSVRPDSRCGAFAGSHNSSHGE